MLVRRAQVAPPVTRLRDEMDRLFERFFGEQEPFRPWEALRFRRFPAVSIWQDDDAIFVEAELPGLTTEDVELSVAGSELTIHGTRPDLELPEGTSVLRRERGTGEFTRVVHLPVDVNEEKVEAVFHNGVLTITLAKADAVRSRHIRVKALPD